MSVFEAASIAIEIVIVVLGLALAFNKRKNYGFGIALAFIIYVFYHLSRFINLKIDTNVIGALLFIASFCMLWVVWLRYKR